MLGFDPAPILLDRMLPANSLVSANRNWPDFEKCRLKADCRQFKANIELRNDKPLEAMLFANPYQK